MTTIACHVDDFIIYISAVRRLSPHTVDAYRRDLKKLTEGIAETPMIDVSALTIRRLIIADRQAHPASLSRRLAAWRTFFDYLIKHQIIDNNPARSVMPPKIPARLPKALTPDETAAFLMPTNDSWLGQRDMAMMELFYSSALRLSELAQLNVNDIDRNNGFVAVQRGKGGRGRVVPIGAKALKALEKWLQQRQLILDQNRTQNALFISKRQTRLTARAIEQRLSVHTQQVGFSRSVSPHMLRHSCASHFLQSSGDLRATQELLGHRDIATTQIYTRLDFQHLANIYDQAHPRAQAAKTAAKKRLPE